MKDRQNGREIVSKLRQGKKTLHPAVRTSLPSLHKKKPQPRLEPISQSVQSSMKNMRTDADSDERKEDETVVESSAVKRSQSVEQLLVSRLRAEAFLSFDDEMYILHILMNGGKHAQKMKGALKKLVKSANETVFHRRLEQVLHILWTVRQSKQSLPPSLPQTPASVPSSTPPKSREEEKSTPPSPSKSLSSSSSLSSSLSSNPFPSVYHYVPRKFPSVAEHISNPASHGRVVLNVLKKIQTRLNELSFGPQASSKEEEQQGSIPRAIQPREKIILVSSASFNPIHKLHIRRFYLAKKFLEAHAFVTVLGGLLSPSHNTLVRQKHRRTPAQILPDGHRLSLCRLMVRGSSWLTVDPWEMTRKRAMDYLALLDHVKRILKERFPSEHIRVVFLCKGRSILKLSPQAMREKGLSCISLCRPQDIDFVSDHLSQAWKGVATLVEDGGVMSRSLASCTSSSVRQRVLEEEWTEVDTLTGKEASAYIRSHRMAFKMKGEEEWTEEDKRLMEKFTGSEDQPYFTSKHTPSLPPIQQP